MHKKIISLLLAIVIVFGISVSVSAEGSNESALETTDEETPAIGLFSLYTKQARAYISISSGTANAKAVFEGYKGTTTKVSISLYLQKKGLLGLYWSDVASWSATYNSYEASMIKTHGGLSNGSYRVKAVFTAHSGSNSETLTEYSDTVKY